MIWMIVAFVFMLIDVVLIYAYKKMESGLKDKYNKYKIDVEVARKKDACRIAELEKNNITKEDNCLRVYSVPVEFERIHYTIELAADENIDVADRALMTKVWPMIKDNAMIEIERDYVRNCTRYHYSWLVNKKIL